LSDHPDQKFLRIQMYRVQRRPNGQSPDEQATLAVPVR
jgi:hypothetical protein